MSLHGVRGPWDPDVWPATAPHNLRQLGGFANGHEPSVLNGVDI